MSLQSAAAGFGSWCHTKDIHFNIPALGSVYIGQHIASVLDGFSKTMSRSLDLDVSSGKDIIFKSGDENYLVLALSGVYVTGIKYKGLGRGIPVDFCHNDGKYSYMLPVCIDDGMIWIKGVNEVKLKAVKQVSCERYTTAELSVSPISMSKKEATLISESIANFRLVSNRLKSRGTQITSSDVLPKPIRQSIPVSKVKPTPETRGTHEPDENLVQLIRTKSWEYEGLLSKVNKYDRPLKEAQDAVERCQKEYQKWLYYQNSSYCKGFSRYRLEDIVLAGKLKIGQFGEYVLDRGSKVPSYTTTHPDTELVTTASCYAPCHGAQLHSYYEYSSGGFQNEYTWLVPTVKSVLHEDEAYKLASEFVNSLDYNKYYPEVKRSFLQLEDAKQRYLELMNQRDIWGKSQECLTLYYKASQVANEISELQARAGILLG